MKKIDLRNDERAIMVAYLNAKKAKEEAEKAEKTTKAAAKELFAKLGKAYKDGEKSEWLTLSIQSKGEKKHIIYTETTAKGTVDWKAYAIALGGTVEDAEDYRKPSNVRTSIDWATDKEEAEIAQG